MELVLHPRLSGRGTIAVWLGALRCRAAPALTWRIDGQPAAPPVVERPLQSVRPAKWLAGDPPRAFTGVYRFGVPPRDEPYDVSVSTADGASATTRTRTLPARLAADDPGRRLNILLCSCYHVDEANSGALRRAVRDAAKQFPLDATFLLGDQVYLDLPTIKDFPDKVEELAAWFEKDYVRNWALRPDFAAVLDAAPSVSMPDDHEFWNNFPNPFVFAGNTHSPQGRADWTEAALAQFDGFQRPGGLVAGAPFVFDVEPLSFFLADTRTCRTENRSQMMSPAALAALEDWVADLNANRRTGVFVSGQSLFREPIGSVKGKFADWEMPNYGDYAAIVRALAAAQRDVLCVTGDVHWGRVTRARDAADPNRVIHEVISSPAALVATVGHDRISAIGAAIGGLFGRKDPWPRHSKVDDPPGFLAQGPLGRRFRCVASGRQVGDHLSVLSFGFEAAKLAATVTYFPVHDAPEVRRPQAVTVFRRTQL